MIKTIKLTIRELENALHIANHNNSNMAYQYAKMRETLGNVDDGMNRYLQDINNKASDFSMFWR